MEMGTRIHEALEQYQLTGTFVQDDRAPFVLAAAPHLGKPGPHAHIEIERGFDMITYEGGPTWKGFIDRLNTALPNPEVLDFKTKSDLRYALTPDELAHDLQLNSYARWFYFVQNPSYDGPLTLTHLYITTKGARRAVPVSTTVNRAQVDAVWQETLKKVRAMDKVAQAFYGFFSLNCTILAHDWRCMYKNCGARRDAEHKVEWILDHLSPAPRDECMRYGGCEFLPHCKIPYPQLISVDEMLENTRKTEGSMDISELFTSMETNGTSAPVKPTTGNGVQISQENAKKPQETPPAAPAGLDFTQMIANLQNSTPAAPAEPPRRAVPDLETRLNDRLAEAGLEQGVAFEPSPTPAKAAGPGPAIVPPDAPQPSPLPVPGQLAAAVEPAPKKRGRPKKDAEAATGDAVAQAAAAVLAGAAPAAEEDEPETQVARKRRLTLYLNCMPIGVKAVMGDAWIQPIIERTCQKLGVADIRLIDFGKGWGHLAQAVREHIAQNPDDVPRHLVITGFSEEAKILRGILMPMATDPVIQGC